MVGGIFEGGHDSVVSRIGGHSEIWMWKLTLELALDGVIWYLQEMKDVSARESGKGKQNLYWALYTHSEACGTR